MSKNTTLRGAAKKAHLAKLAAAGCPAAAGKVTTTGGKEIKPGDKIAGGALAAGTEMHKAVEHHLKAGMERIVDIAVNGYDTKNEILLPTSFKSGSERDAYIAGISKQIEGLHERNRMDLEKSDTTIEKADAVLREAMMVREQIFTEEASRREAFSDEIKREVSVLHNVIAFAKNSPVKAGA